MSARGIVRAGSSLSTFSPGRRASLVGAVDVHVNLLGPGRVLRPQLPALDASPPLRTSEAVCSSGRG